MQYKLLNRTHPDAHLDTVRRYGDLAAGGPRFTERVGAFLPKGDTETEAAFKRRCERAFYTNHCSRILNFFASALLACPPKITAEPDPGAWYEELREDADGRGTDLDAVARDLLVRAMIARRAYLRVEFPDGTLPENATVADADAMGLRVPRLVAVPTEHITHWKRRPDGSLLWAVEHTVDAGLEEFEDETERVTETWTLWRADGDAVRWQVEYEKGKTPAWNRDIAEVEPPRNPTRAMPLVELCLPDTLWVMSKVADPAVEHFRKQNALSWAIDRTCYAMPWFFLQNRRKPPTMGTGFYGILSVNEKVEWPTPPAAPFEVIRGYTAELVQEIHRVAEQMALGLDQSRGAVVGRSGASKAQDAESTERVLKAFGKALKDPLERALDLCARGRGEDTDFDVGGMDVYDMADAGALTDIAVASESLRVPSATYRRSLYKALVRAQLPNLTEEERQAIDKEIDVGVTDEEVQRPPETETDPNAPPEQQVQA